MIPRSNDQVVMIISGKSRGSYGIMVDKIKGTIIYDLSKVFISVNFRFFKAISQPSEKSSFQHPANYGLNVT